MARKRGSAYAVRVKRAAIRLSSGRPRPLLGAETGEHAPIERIEPATARAPVIFAWKPKRCSGSALHRIDMVGCATKIQGGPRWG